LHACCKTVNHEKEKLQQLRQVHQEEIKRSNKGTIPSGKEELEERALWN